MMKYSGRIINAGTILYDTLNDIFWICCYIEDISDPEAPEGEEIYFGYEQDITSGIKYQFGLSFGYTATVNYKARINENEIRFRNITVGFSNKWILNHSTTELKNGLRTKRFIKVKEISYHEMAGFLDYIKHLDDDNYDDDCDDENDDE